MKLITRSCIFVTAAAGFALSSCSTGGSSPSGFLSNYQQLDGGYGTADAVSAYVKPGVDLKKYDSLLIDPVTTIVASPGVDTRVTGQLAAYMSEALRTQSAGKLKVVSVAGPTTMRVRTALTDVIEGQTAGTPVKTVHTSAQASLSGNLGTAEIAAFISKVSFEGEVLDSVTGERLMANVDHRLGKKRDATPKTAWSEIRKQTNEGAARLIGRYEALRGR
ncbi:MAG: DUF3313 domain-containing protein [Verrucomicrobiota bacterium]